MPKDLNAMDQSRVRHVIPNAYARKPEGHHSLLWPLVPQKVLRTTQVAPRLTATHLNEDLRQCE